MENSKNNDNLENLNKFKNKISYIFKRTFVPFGKAPRMSIVFLQLILIITFLLFLISIIGTISFPKNLDETEKISGKLKYFEYVNVNKGKDYCILNIELNSGEKREIYATTCGRTIDDDVIYDFYHSFGKWKQYNIPVNELSKEVTLWIDRDYTTFNKFRIYQFFGKYYKRSEYIISFEKSKEFFSIDKKVSIYSLICILISLLLIFRLNTDEVQARYKYQKEKEKKNKISKTINTKFFKKG